MTLRHPTSLDEATIKPRGSLEPIPIRITPRTDNDRPRPITVGLPFPKGRLKGDESFAFHPRDLDGVALSAQTTVLARWSDGSAKWVLVDGILQGREDAWNIAFEEAPARRPVLRVAEENGRVLVDSGSRAFRLDPEKSAWFSQVAVDGEDVLDEVASGIFLTDAAGAIRSPRPDRYSIKTRGPIRSTLTIAGVFPGTPCRFRSEFSFFSGTGLARVRFTIHNPRRARHPGGLWDLGDPNSFRFRDLSLTLGLREGDAARVSWTVEEDQPPRSGPVEIYQDSSGGENWRSRTHVNAEGRIPLAFRGYRSRAGESESTGLRAEPITSIETRRTVLTATIPEFWKQFPKAIEAANGRIKLGLFPESAGNLFELQGGERKTHDVWFCFDSAGSTAIEPLEWTRRPPRVVALPEFYAESEALPFFVPSSRVSDDPVQSMIDAAVSGNHDLFKRREVIDEYGWRNYGEVYADHEAAYYKGPAPVISHYNNQYDFVLGALTQYLRSGSPEWFDLGDALARHVADIDVYHTTEDKSAYNGGLFWHSDHYKDAGASTHRAYSRINLKPGTIYGGGPSNEHNYACGLLHHYYLTGDSNSREAVVSLADWVVNMEDGRLDVLGFLDNGPTGLASRTATTDYHGPGRGCGNSINVLLDAWQLTGRRDYLALAESLIRRNIHPDDDVDARDLLNVELRWSYTVFLSALARYLLLKRELDERDQGYAHARESLLTYARWMVEREEPYFDHPEKLEYPTETWGAQEFRKANVLRLAAAHADADLRARLLRRGDELAERALRDVVRFGEPVTARAIAILMIEGSRDLYFRTNAVEAIAPPSRTFDLGRPEVFIPQRERAKRLLKTPKGMIRAALGLANPRNWVRIRAAIR